MRSSLVDDLHDDDIETTRIIMTERADEVGLCRPATHADGHLDDQRAEFAVKISVRMSRTL
jgi:hypothetical protein